MTNPIQVHPTSDRRDEYLALVSDLHRALDRARRLGNESMAAFLEQFEEDAREGWRGEVARGGRGAVVPLEEIAPVKLYRDWQAEWEQREREQRKSK